MEPRTPSSGKKFPIINHVYRVDAPSGGRGRTPLREHLSFPLYFTASYFLGRGGISDVSTGSNSNFGSSASGAK
jgi:hypothetical protein